MRDSRTGDPAGDGDSGTARGLCDGGLCDGGLCDEGLQDRGLCDGELQDWGPWD